MKVTFIPEDDYGIAEFSVEMDIIPNVGDFIGTSDRGYLLIITQREFVLSDFEDSTDCVSVNIWISDEDMY